MYNVSKRVERHDETFIERLPWASLIMEQGTQRLVMTDRIVSGTESLQSVGETTYGPSLTAGQFLVRTQTAWVEQAGAGTGADLGTLEPTDPINWHALIGDYYLTGSTAIYPNVPLNLGWHFLEGYYYRQYVPTEDYVINEVIFFNGHIYLCTTDVINAPLEFPYDLFAELDTGLMYTDEQDLSMIQDEYYRLCELDYITGLTFYIIFGKDHIIQAAITSAGELNITSSSWTTVPYISELHLERDGTNRNRLVFKALSTTTDTHIHQSGWALVGSTPVEPERPITVNGPLNNPSASIYHLNQASGSYRSGEIRSGAQSLYLDSLGNPVPIHAVTDNDSILVHKKYVNDEIAKQRTLVAPFDPNNKYGWVDLDINVIPLTDPLNNGYYYIVTANSTVDAADVINQPPNTSWSGSNTAVNTTFVIAGTDVTAHFFAPERCFLQRSSDSASYSVNYSAATFTGGNTEITLELDPSIPAPANDYDLIFLYVAWPPYFANRYLPPLNTGLLSNDTIISTGDPYTAGPPESGGWALIKTGVESVAERVMISQNVPNHGFVTGQQIYVERGPTYPGGNTVTALRFDIDAVEGDLTARFLAGSLIAFIDSTQANGPYASIVVSSDFNVTLAGQTTITIDQQGGVDPLLIYDIIYFEEVTWKLAKSDNVKTLKTAMVLNRSTNFFYAVMYGAIIFENIPLTTYRVGQVYYLSNTIAGEVQNPAPSAPVDIGSYVQGAFEVINYVPTSATHGNFQVKVVDWTSRPVVDTAILGADFIQITGQTLAAGVSISDQVYKDATGVWQLAMSDEPGTLKQGMVNDIISPPSTDATIITYGQVNLGVHGLTIGGTYYLSDTTPGAVTDIEPTASGTYSQAVFEVLDTNIIKVIDQSVLEN